MSTKIYNGYRFNGNPDIREIQQFCHELRDKVKPIAEALYFKQFFHEYFTVIDKNIFGYWDDPMYFIGEKGKYITMRLERYMAAKINNIKISNQRDPDFDFGFEISILPVKNMVLLMYFTERETLRKAFDEMPEVSEYHYQNQTDRPKYIPEKNWQNRRKRWNMALGGDGWSTPMECGFGYCPYDVSRFSIHFGVKEAIERVGLENIFPSIESRSLEIARIMHWKEWLEQNPMTEEEKQKRNASWDHYCKYEKYLKTEPGQSKQEQLKSEVREKLPFHNPTYQEIKEEMEKDIIWHPDIENKFSNPEYKPYWLRDKN